jgi:alpha-mannosidase
LTEIDARLALFAGLDANAARDAEIGLRAVAAGAAPLLPPGRALLEVRPSAVVLTALKPPASGDGVVLRLLNPTDVEQQARLRLGFPVVRAVPVRLDETPCGPSLPVVDGCVDIAVPPHALRTLLLQP